MKKFREKRTVSKNGGQSISKEEVRAIMMTLLSVGVREVEVCSGEWRKGRQ